MTSQTRNLILLLKTEELASKNMRRKKKLDHYSTQKHETPSILKFNLENL